MAVTIVGGLGAPLGVDPDHLTLYFNVYREFSYDQWVVNEAIRVGSIFIDAGPNLNWNADRSIQIRLNASVSKAERAFCIDHALDDYSWLVNSKELRGAK